MKLDKPARAVLGDDPDTVVRLRLLIDVLHESRRAPILRGVRRAAAGSKWVQRLSTTQRPDGGWGRFHSRGTRTGLKTPTTEFAVARAVYLGLDLAHPLVRRARAYLSRLLTGRLEFPDPPEKNDSWPTGSSLFVGATLGLVDPAGTALSEVATLWAEILRRTFVGGRYDQTAELRAHWELTGQSGERIWLRLNNRYAVALLGARARVLPPAVERAYVRWLWQRPAGLGYLGVPLCRPPECRRASVVDAWFTAQELLSAFPTWRTVARPVISWLHAQRNADGLWELGPRWAGSAYFPLSDSWRSRRARVHDWSTRVLCLLARYAAQPGRPDLGGTPRVGGR